MHKLIREKGGAYGSFVTMGINNTLTLSSYRDPNFVKTYLNFEKSA